MCEVLEVTSAVGSPTFSIINEYRYKWGIIYHIDLYRLKNEEEALRAGVEDCLYSGALCLVEWPERAPGVFPEDTVHAYLEINGPNNRLLRIDDKSLFLK
jgi:tRNA threonylcarbamoyladenosine biosynthesis protein TsaE